VFVNNLRRFAEIVLPIAGNFSDNHSFQFFIVVFKHISFACQNDRKARAKGIVDIERPNSLSKVLHCSTYSEHLQQNH
jgi:hypothetical protein